jgi:hypothetical protein
MTIAKRSKWVVAGITGVVVAVASVPAAQAVFRTLTATGALTFVDETNDDPRSRDFMVGDVILAQAIFDDSRVQPDGSFESGVPGEVLRIEIDNQVVAEDEIFDLLFADGVSASSFVRFFFGTDTCAICSEASRVLELSDNLELVDVGGEAERILLRGEFDQVAISPD